MSTITKLDPNVRLDRYLRKQQRRDLQADIQKARTVLERTVLALVLKQVTTICLDPTRTGERKEAILAKLAGVAAPSLALPPSGQASTPL